MTPEEERMMRMQVQQLINTGSLPGPSMQMQSGTKNPYETDAARKAATARASASTGGRASQLKSQQAYADRLRQGGAPKGKTVGPLDVYMAPNWGENLAALAGPAIGGYMSGQLKDDYDALDAAEADKAAAAAELKQMDLADARGFTKAEREAGQGFRAGESVLGRDFTADQNAINNAFRRSERQEAEAAAAGLQGLRLAAAADEGEADRTSRQGIAGVTQAGQDRRDNIEMVYIDEEGNPDFSRTRFASPSAEGMVWGDGKLVDEDRWQGRDDPNLTAATTGESRGTAAQKTAEYRANTFGDALSGIKKTMYEGGYDPTSGRAFVDKYANQNDLLRWASTEGGQKYNSDASTVKEAALRTSTGAAAPNKENSEYMTTLIPGPWDKPGTVDFKMKKLEGIHTRLLELAGLEGTTQGDLDAEADRLIEDARREETAVNVAATKQNGDEWEDETHRYRKWEGKLQSEKK